MTLAIHWDKKWGGFYLHKGHTFRLCLGYLAITFVPLPFDEILDSYITTQEAAGLANNALYFADRSDYQYYLWRILETLYPGTKRIERDSHKLKFIEEID